MVGWLIANNTYSIVLLAAGAQVGHGNISYASHIIKVVVLFLKEQGFVNEGIESGLYINNQFVQISLVPSTRITVCGGSPIIPSEVLV